MTTITNVTKLLFSSLVAVVAFLVFAPPAVSHGKVQFHWDRTLKDCIDHGNPGQCRWLILDANGQFAGLAVQDQETGLVWERSPTTVHLNWQQARSHCWNLAVADRKGWRLPQIEELQTLLNGANPLFGQKDPFNVPTPPFQVWSALQSDLGVTAVVVIFGPSDTTVGDTSQGNARSVWCVRGGFGAVD